MSSGDDRYSRLKDLVLRAKDLDAAARRALLDAECGDDADLRAEAESLLEHDSTSPSLLEESGLLKVGSALKAALTDEEPPAPEQIGPYRITGELGRGGMGVVYEAEQHEPIRRTVALKLIKQGLDTERVVARFRSERQALARMSHPAIAQVLDAGADSSGRPYFVMEKVDGEPISSYCRRRGSSVRERLVLFLQVGDAVAHAHQRGIMHRDLKPSNILVSEESGQARPKVIDFGIAKATEPGADPGLTREATAIGTPEYMSPEQAGVLDSGVDTRTDVYALGVVLYEMLTGKRPYEFGSPSSTEMKRVFESGLPTRPSLAAETGGATERVARQLRGDLDNIALKAMRHEPDRRYASVPEFMQDVRRHLDGHPVAARPDTWSYRAGKFVRRNAVPVGAAALLFLVIAGAAVGLGLQSARIAEERDRALEAEARAAAEARTAGEVVGFLTEMFTYSNPYEARGEDITARQMLEFGVERIPEMELQPDVRGQLLTTLGEVQHSLGQFEAAEELLGRALDVQRRHLGDRHEAVGVTLDRLATLRHDQGDYPKSAELRREAIAIYEETEQDVEVIAISQAYLAASLQVSGEREEARELLEEGLASLRGALAEGTLAEPEIARADAAWILNQLGYLLYEEEPEGAAERFRQALAMQEELFAGDHPDIAGTLNNIGGLQQIQGECEDAEVTLTRALTMYENLYGRDHAAVGRAYHVLGSAKVCLGELDSAYDHFRTSVDILTRILGEEHPYPANSYSMLGRVEQLRERWAEAERWWRSCLRVRAALFPLEEPSLQYAREELSKCLAKLGRSPDGDELLARTAVPETE